MKNLLRHVALVLSFAMILTAMPLNAFAEEVVPAETAAVTATEADQVSEETATEEAATEETAEETVTEETEETVAENEEVEEETTEEESAENAETEAAENAETETADVVGASALAAFSLASEAANEAVDTVIDTETELATALAAGGTVTLGGDIVVNTMIEIPTGVTATLDLNGKAITVAESTGNHIYALNNKGTLTIKDSVGSGSITARGIYNGYDGSNTSNTVEGAKMTIESGTFYAMDTNGGAAVFNCAELIINGGTFDGKVAGINNRAKGVVTINNATVRSVSSYAIQNNGGEMTINNATVDRGFGAVGAWGGTTVINDGTFLPTGAKGSTCHVVYVSENTNVTINGGTFKMNYPANAVPDSGSAVASYYSGSVSITGGTFTSHFANVSPVELSTGAEITGGKYLTHAGETSNHSFVTKYIKEGYEQSEDGTVAEEVYAAKIGETSYKTLEEAFAAAKAGDTVEILAGEYTQDITVNKDITVVGETDAEGNNLVTFKGKLSVTADGATVKNINVDNGSSTAGYISAKDVLIEDCNVKGGNGFRYCYTSGTVTFKDSVVTGSTYGIHFDGNAGGNIVIDNCTVTGWTSFASTITKVTMTDTTFAEGNYNYIRFYQDAEISGCTFNEEMGIDIANSVDADVTVTNSTVENGGKVEDLFDGYDIVNKTITVDSEELTKAASIAMNGETVYYNTMEEALEALSGEDGKFEDTTATITLYEDAVIDLNGKTLTGNIIVSEDAEVEIKNGTIDNNDSEVSAVETAGKLTLTDVDITSARHAVRVDGDNAEAVINGGTYKVDGTAGMTTHAVNVSGNGATVTINDGTFVGPKGTAGDSGAAVNVQAGSEVVINGGDFSGGLNDTIAKAETAAVVINGGTFDQNPSAFMEEDKHICTVDGKSVVHGTTYVAAKAATCTKAGNIAYYKCENGKFFTDAKATNEITTPVVIAATGHKFGGWYTVKEPNCYNAGYEAHVCSVCNEAESRPLAATSHNYDINGVCAICGQTKASAPSRTNPNTGVHF